MVDGETGFVVADQAEAESALVRLLDDPALRARLGAAGRARVEQELTYDVLADRLREALT